MDSISRRSFFRAAGAAAGAAALAPGRERSPQQAASQRPPHSFFNAAEAAFIEPAVARLIPADETGPGALEADVPAYIDRQLAGAWGAGERLYRSGPWQLGRPEQGYQLLWQLVTQLVFSALFRPRRFRHRRAPPKCGGRGIWKRARTEGFALAVQSADAVSAAWSSILPALGDGLGHEKQSMIGGEAMAKMKVAQVAKAGADFEIVERDIPQPGPGQVRIRVQACGVCHSDVLTKEGGWPGLVYPRVPGHEVAGVIDEAGSGVTQWQKGQRVGVGWHGAQDGTCLACRRGDFANCANLKITGLSYDGGYQEYMIAPVEAVARMPESLDAAEAAPLLCAEITTFNALRHSGALPSDLVAVQGIGGLGHLGIQFAQKFGYQVAAIGRGPGNAALAKKLGASVYIDSTGRNAAAELQKLGGARVILATAPSSKAMSSLVDGLGMNGKMVVVGATTDPIEVTPLQLISGMRSIQGWASGIPTDSEDTLRFAELTGVRPMIEKYPLAKAGEAYARMMSGKAEFRVVLTM